MMRDKAIYITADITTKAAAALVNRTHANHESRPKRAEGRYRPTRRFRQPETARSLPLQSWP